MKRKLIEWYSEGVGDVLETAGVLFAELGYFVNIGFAATVDCDGIVDCHQIISIRGEMIAVDVFVEEHDGPLRFSFRALSHTLMGGVGQESYGHFTSIEELVDKVSNFAKVVLSQEEQEETGPKKWN